MPGADYKIEVIGAPRAPLRDFYHALLRQPWPLTIAVISCIFLAVNVVFAFGYSITGGVVHARPGSFVDAFFFSVQTMATIGYGTMYPESTAANMLMVVESITSVTLTALVTGLIFAKFSRPTARIVFSRNAVISPMNGVPTLMLRVGNERGNRIVDATIRASISRTERTAEGTVFYRNIDLVLVRERLFSLARSWNVLHVIDEKSPFYGVTPESMVAQELELNLLLVGLDDTSMQTIQATRQYFAPQMIFGAKLADVLSESPDGALILDLHKFHEIEPTQPTPEFPYPAPLRANSGGGT